MRTEPTDYVKLIEYDPKVIIHKVMDFTPDLPRLHRRANNINIKDATEIFAWVEDAWLLQPTGNERHVDLLIWLDKLGIIKFNEEKMHADTMKSRVNNNALRVKDLMYYLTNILQAHLLGVNDDLMGILHI